MAKIIKTLKKSVLETWLYKDIYRYSVLAISKGLSLQKNRKRQEYLM